MEPFALRSRALVSRRDGERGGAVVELAIAAVLLLAMLFGVVEFGRALLLRHAMTSMSREAANLESRGTSMADALQATIANSGSTNLAQDGYVILTAVARDVRGHLTITAQVAGGGLPQASRIGTIGLPDVFVPNAGVPLPGHTLYVAEIFARFSTVTPIGTWIGSTLPSSLYDVAYF